MAILIDPPLAGSVQSLDEVTSASDRIYRLRRPLTFGKNTDKSKKRRLAGASKSMISLVAGGGFEPPTFGL